VTVAIVTGSAGLIGSESARAFASLGLHIVGIDNDMRRVFFGEEASTRWNAERLGVELGTAYSHANLDIRDRDGLTRIFQRYRKDISLVIHTAAQPSHDWAARDPIMDFEINAAGTLNMLELTRAYSPEATFIFTSTNKVYGATPNRLPLEELETRWEIEPGHTYADGIREDMSIDQTLHSVFGASKVAADVMVQEFGLYFDMNTACFRGGTLTGPAHSATELHGFLGYVMRCAMERRPYTVYGYQGKQVRDAIHSADLIAAFEQVFRSPKSGGVYNIGGGRFSNASVREAIALAEEISGNAMAWSYNDTNRVGDHIWWIGSNAAFQADYPEWQLTYDVLAILREMHEANMERWQS
jgi:CDP-paratose 2-epimerase